MFVRLAACSLLASSLFGAAPCVKAAAECTDWITFGAGPSRSLIYRSHSLYATNEKIIRALIVVHGMNRNADNYFETALAGAFLADALENTVVIAPRFASNAGGECSDKLAPNEVSWPCDVWRSGGPGASDPGLTSFGFVDEILLKLAARQAFPNLRSIVLTGHSAGGQFAVRYAMANTVNDKLGVPVTYVVANPSSYPYLDAVRPIPDGSMFEPYADASNCTGYDQWPYGSRNRRGYTANLTDAQLKAQLGRRNVVYLLGELDTLPLAGFDNSCPAMAQGSSRRQRGETWLRYVNGKLEAHHRSVIVPMCGHNARCMYTADAALPELFPK
jgi:pimeloyl-ACP methyl ester carboxylesterase